MIGLDTDSIIQYYSNDEKLLILIESLEEDFCSTIMNFQEIMFGIDPKNEKFIRERYFFNTFFENIILIDIDKNSCLKANEIFWELKKIGKLNDKFDCMIAGILLSNGVDKIITRNVKHFENIPGLTVISY
jgi:predicted nucleic acid-binding protein